MPSRYPAAAGIPVKLLSLSCTTANQCVLAAAGHYWRRLRKLTNPSHTSAVSLNVEIPMHERVMPSKEFSWENSLVSTLFRPWLDYRTLLQGYKTETMLRLIDTAQYGTRSCSLLDDDAAHLTTTMHAALAYDSQCDVILPCGVDAQEHAHAMFVYLCWPIVLACKGSQSRLSVTCNR